MSDIQVLVDTSVLVKWFHTEDEPEAAQARAVRDAHRDGVLTAYVLDLTVYELGDLLLNTLRWPPARVADQIEDVLVICGPPLTLAPTWRRDAVALAAEHRLSFYDAAFAAAAHALHGVLLSTDKRLIAAGLAVSPARFVDRHGAHIRNTP